MVNRIGHKTLLLCVAAGILSALAGFVYPGSPEGLTGDGRTLLWGASLVFLVGTIAWLYYRWLLPVWHLHQQLRQVIEDAGEGSLRIAAGSREIRGFGNTLNDLLAAFRQQLDHNALQRDKIQQQQATLEQLSNFDSLTGLHNRRFFLDALSLDLSRSQRHDQDLALVSFDLDGFKRVNDSLGHAVGDQVLIEVSQRIRGLMREGDLFSRLGGDEFLLLIPNNPDDMTLVQIATRIIDACKKPFNVDNFEIQIAASLGVARAKDANYQQSDFINHADMARQRSKHGGQGRFTIFVPNMMEDSKRKLTIVNSLTNAMREGQFELFYQAKVSPDKRCVGFEALLRWNSVDLGIVSPAEFIPIAEQSGRIVQITRWVIETLCRELPALQESVGDPVPVSVNLSAFDLCQSDLFDVIRELFTQYAVNPSSIEFEVTESAYLENFDMANRFFRKIRELGCSIALDDFGTGYSSLSYLTQLPINTLKIDKQFIEKIGLSKSNTLVTTTIIDMAKRLQLTICAEGVETPEQFEFLVNNGCHQLQGYLFSKPSNLKSMVDNQDALATNDGRLV